MSSKKLATETKPSLSVKGVSQTTGVLLGVSILVGTVLWLMFIIGRN